MKYNRNHGVIKLEHKNFEQLKKMRGFDGCRTYNDVITLLLNEWFKR